MGTGCESTRDPSGGAGGFLFSERRHILWVLEQTSGHRIKGGDAFTDQHPHPGPQAARIPPRANRLQRTGEHRRRGPGDFDRTGGVAPAG